MAKYVELGQSDNRDVDLTDVKLVKLKPETEQLVVEPTTTEQTFKPSVEKYFDDVTVNAIKTKSLEVEPKTTGQDFVVSDNTFYDNVSVKPVTSAIDPNIQEYNIRKGVTILGKVGNVEVDKPDQEKVVEASITHDVVVQADTGYELAKVTIPKVDISAYVKEEVSVDVVPSEDTQTITPADDKVYNEVNVGAIPSDYVGSAVTRVPTKTYMPTTTDIEIQANQFLTGTQIVRGDLNLIAENIKESVQIFGVVGTHRGGSVKFGELVDGSITEVTAQDLAEVVTIRNSVFEGLRITSVETSTTVTTIGDSAFANNQISSLTLNEGVTTIGDSAFANNPITAVTIPTTITTIGDSAFAGTQITELDMSNISTPPSVTSTSFPTSLTAISVKYADYDTYKTAWSDYADKIVRLPAIPSTITVTVNDYLGSLVGGASVTISGNGNAYTGTTNENGIYIQGDLQPATYIISVADLDGYKTPSNSEVVVLEDTQNAVTITYLEKPRVNEIFGENTPQMISEVSQEISANNMTSAEVEATYGWKVGDTVSYQLTTGENIEMRIIGFNHDDLSDGSGKAGITLEMTHCLSKGYPMSKNPGTNAGGYASSKVKTETLPMIKTLLPQEWQDIIKTVNKKSANGGDSNYSEVLTLSEDLFLLSGYEVAGSNSFAQSGSDEGMQYEYWKSKSQSDRIKMQDTNADGVLDTAFRWWLRSSSYNTTSAFCAILQNGMSYWDLGMYAYGVSFAFCV